MREGVKKRIVRDLAASGGNHFAGSALGLRVLTGTYTIVLDSKPNRA
jgi:hypothetical protein